MYNVGRSKSSAAWNSGKLAVMRQGLRRQAIQRLGDQNYQLKYNIVRLSVCGTRCHKQVLPAGCDLHVQREQAEDGRPLKSRQFFGPTYGARTPPPHTHILDHLHVAEFGEFRSMTVDGGVRKETKRESIIACQCHAYAWAAITDIIIAQTKQWCSATFVKCCRKTWTRISHLWTRRPRLHALLTGKNTLIIP